MFLLFEHDFISGAHARWRTLHEFEVISQIISKNEEHIAQRYLDHRIVSDYREIEEIAENKKDAKEIETKKAYLNQYKDIIEKYDETIKKYDKAFKGDYGWASPLKKIAEIKQPIRRAHFYNHGTTFNLLDIELKSYFLKTIFQW